MTPKAKLVTAAVIEYNGLILIAQRSDVYHRGGWEFPGGKVEAGESEEEALVREIDEEFGIRISCTELMGESLYDYGRGRILLKAWHCHWLSGELEVREHACIRWVSVNELGSYDFLPADLPFVKQLQP